MKIETGKSYKTQGGKRVWVVGENPNAAEDSEKLMITIDEHNVTAPYGRNGVWHDGSSPLMCIAEEWPELKRVPLEASDIVPGCAIRRRDDWQWHVVLTAKEKGIDTPFEGLEYKQLMDRHEILYPGETEWKPCWKEA